MPFERPTLPELIARVEDEHAQRLGLGALLRRSTLKVIARVEGGLSHQLHGHLDFNANQIIPDTAAAEFLERWASIFGVQRKAATAATGSVTLTGTDGTTVPAATVLQRADGQQYSTDASGVISAGTVSLAVTAVVAGDAGNADTATEVSLIAPIAGVNADGTVDAPGIVSGADQEDDDDLRARLEERLQNPPQGGAAADYVLAALAVPEVTRAFALPAHFGLGTVGVTFLVDDHPTSIIPDAAKVAEVQVAIDAFRPVTASATVFAPTAVPLNPSLSVTPDTGAVRAAVEASLEDLLIQEAEPGGTLPLSKIREAVSNAAGEQDHTLSSPAADVTVAAGEISTLGTVTFT